MIDMRYKPYYLPQVSTPYDVILEKLDGEDIGYDIIDVNPDELNTSQGITFSDEVGGVQNNDENPIWVAGDNKVIDGHHRWVKAMQSSTPIKAIKIQMNDKDACRLLNKIQDIYDYEENQKMEEVVAQDMINQNNEIDSDYDFLNQLENDNDGVNEGENEGVFKGNEKTIIGYRKEPIRENSVVGNFFTLSPIEGFSKYEIDFDNLLDTNELGLSYKESQQPVDILAKIWFPHINFEKISELYNISSDNLKAKAIAYKGNKLGFDGIKYGDTIIQGLK